MENLDYENPIDSVSILTELASIRQSAYSDGYTKGKLDAYNEMLKRLGDRISELENE